MKIGTLNEWVKHAQVVTGVREGVMTSEAQWVKDLEREFKELRWANEILKLPVVLRLGGARPPTEVLRASFDKHWGAFGIEPLCKVLQVAPSAYRRHAASLREPYKRCARALRHELLVQQIQRVRPFDAHGHRAR